MLTEKPIFTFRWWQKVLLAVGLLAGLGLLTVWFLTTATFWQQVGWRLVAGVQNRVNGEVSVHSISGNLITGMVFHGVKISRNQSDLIQVKELEVSVSLLSFFKLQPVIRTLAFRQPKIFLRQDIDGSWNLKELLKKRPPPPFSQIQLRSIRIQNGFIEVNRPEQQQIFKDIEARTNLTIQAPGRPQLSVNIHQGFIGFTSPPYPRLQTDFALTISKQEIEFYKTALSLADIPVLNLQGKISNLATLPELALNFEIPELSGPQLHQLWSGWPQTLPVQAGFKIQGPLEKIEITGTGALQNCQGKVTGSWERSAAVPSGFSLVLDFRNLNGKILSACQVRPDVVDALTPLNGILTVTGLGQPWPIDNLQARLELEPFSYGKTKFESAVLTSKLIRERLQNLVLKLQGNFGRLEAEANGQLLQLIGPRTETAGEVKLAANGLNPALLLGAKAPPGSLDGKFSGDFQLPPTLTWNQARLSGKLVAAGKLREYNFQELSAQGTWEAGELRLNPARLIMNNLRAEVQGRVSPDNADIKLTLDLLSPGPWPLLPSDFKGQLRADGTLKGPWQSLAYHVNFLGKSLSWRHLNVASFQGQTAGTASSDTFRISSFNIRAQNLVTPVGHFGQIKGIGQTQGANLVFDLKSNTPGQAGGLAGMASWEKGVAQIKVNTFQWGTDNFQIATVEPLIMSVAPGKFEISPLRLRYQKALFSLVGKLTNEEVLLHAKLENLQLADVSKFVPEISLFKGSVNVQADITGPAQAPVVKAQLNVAPGQIGKFNFDSFQSTCQFQNNILTLSGSMLEQPNKGKLLWQGTAPLNFSLQPWSWRLPENGLQMRVWSDNLNLALLAGLIPGVSAAEGPMKLQAQIAGSLLHPLLSGYLRYGPGSLTIRPSGAPLAIEPGELRLEGDRLILPHLVFHSGDGNGAISGGARLANLKLQDVQLSLKAANLLIIRREGSQAVASGQVSLNGSWPNFRSEGRLTVHQGQFRLSFFRSEKNKEIILLPRKEPLPAASLSPQGVAAVEKNFLVNLVIDIPGGVWLRDKEVNCELEGEIKVLRQVNGPRYLGGWVKAKKGIFAINNKNFTVEKAVLLFPGEPNKPIVIDARAARQVDEYTLYVAASGPVDNPRTRLESNPPLPSRDQLSLMIFDHLANKMTREEYITVTQKAMGVLGSLTAQKLKSFFGGNLPLLGEVSPTTSQEALGVGKKLGKDITVSYEHKLNPLPGEDANQIRLDYKIHKHFSAESQLGRKNTGGDIFFNIDF